MTFTEYNSACHQTLPSKHCSLLWIVSCYKTNECPNCGEDIEICIYTICGEKSVSRFVVFSMMKCVRWFWWSYPLTMCKQMQKALTLIWARIRQHLWNITLIIDTYLSLVVSIGKIVWYLVKLGAICLWIRTCIAIIFVYLLFVTHNCKCCFNKRGVEFTSLSEIAD